MSARTSPTTPNQLCGADKNDLNANKERRLAAAAGHSCKSLRRSEAEARAAGWGGHTSPAIASSAAVLLYSSVSVSVSAPSFFTASARFSPFTLVSITNSGASALRWLTMASSHRHATTFPVWFFPCASAANCCNSAPYVFGGIRSCSARRCRCLSSSDGARVMRGGRLIGRTAP